MNQLSNLNATVVKEVFYNSSLNPNATTINITVENCSVNAFIQQIIFYLTTPNPTFASTLSVALLDRGNGYPNSINGISPMTFTTIGTSPLIYPSIGAVTPEVIVQNGNTVIVDVIQSVQDSEGLGNIYVQLTATGAATFNTSFTMAVVYRPEATYNTKLNTRNQISNDKYPRMLSQVGMSTYVNSTTSMTDQTNFVAHNFNPRNNVDTTTFGFSVFSTSPIFYFGTPWQTKRWFLGFGNDNTPNLGIITFSYFSGTANTFVALSTTVFYNGAQGPGTYKFAYDGVIIFNPPSDWSPVKLIADPLTIYNTTMIGLGTLSTNNIIPNPAMYWIQCQVGFATTGALTIATVLPLIDPALSLTYRRRLI